MANTYTVKSADTLYDIVNKPEIKEAINNGKSLTSDQRIDKICKINNIPNRNIIYSGQVLKLTASGASSSSVVKKTTTANNSNAPTIMHFGVQAGSDGKTLVASWGWSRTHTAKYRVRWTYSLRAVGAEYDHISYVGSDAEETNGYSTFSIPDNADYVYFTVKPISSTYKDKNGNEIYYWTANWSTPKIYSNVGSPPDAPGAPNVEMKQYKLTVSIDNLDSSDDVYSRINKVEFEIVQDDSKSYKKVSFKPSTGSASYTVQVQIGHTYKARCRVKTLYTDYGKWSGYSSNVRTAPPQPNKIVSLKALSETSIYISWLPNSTATTDEYEIQYTDDKRYFDSSSSVSSTTVPSSQSHSEITGLETGKEYFFRVRAKNDIGESEWTSIQSIIVGKKPSPPTTWSSTTTCVIGDKLYFFWTHNSEDGSSEKTAELFYNINGNSYTKTITKSGEEAISYFKLDTSTIRNGATINWKVRTKGLLNEYSEWSASRLVYVYPAPSLSLSIKDSSGNYISENTKLESFPFYISGTTNQSSNQKPIGYSVSIISNSSYESLDNFGNACYVKKNDELYSQYFNTQNELLVEISPSSIRLENEKKYTINCTVSMSSGLTATDSFIFISPSSSELYTPNAEVSINSNLLTASIKPYCNYYPCVYYKVTYNSASGLYTKTKTKINSIEGTSIDEYTTTDDVVYSDGNSTYFCICESETPELAENVILSVYRREFDGRLVEIGTDIPNDGKTFVVDPHPALDYARYRIIAKYTDSGMISFYDAPGVLVGEKTIVIQWDEKWSSLKGNIDDNFEEPPWSGSSLKLNYNIDVSDSNSPDVSLVNYVGRSHPVSYYGTHLGSTSNWSAAIDKEDTETLYLLRKLSIWMGDVYVREPSGSGYWANIKVSFSQTHCEVTIPVTLSLTRVEGGSA